MIFIMFQYLKSAARKQDDNRYFDYKICNENISL
jgi:hypothetical protein